uniref:Wsv332-like protein n=1 Tax=Pasiphaea japonica whispovirus TaxID=2984286 RepID=A0A9C7C0N6_9VIRU|nr:MAG: wsv332-like protein [Pasiphaea japonica whispovirus]
MESVNFIKDETSSCVVNVHSIKQRLHANDEQEMEYVQHISAKFLTHLIRIAHCRDANNIKAAAYSLIRLSLNDIFSSNARALHLRSFNLAPASSLSATASNSNCNVESATKTFMTQMLGCLDPAVIISTILGSSSSDGNVEGDNLLTAVDGMMSVLNNYNPLKLDDIVMLEICNVGNGCDACHGLVKALNDEILTDAMLFFLRCINHNRFNFGGDSQSACASEQCLNLANAQNTVVVPLRKIMLGCLNVQLLNFGDNIDYSDTDEQWLTMLYESVNKTSLFDRAIVAHLYAYMMFSRHRVQSGDCIKQFLYTIFVRFIYSATEILFCKDENSSAEFDNHNFLDYVEAMTNVSALSSSLNVVSAFRSCIVKGASVAPLLDIISSDWKKNYKTSCDIHAVGLSLSNCITDMMKTSRFIKKNSNKNTSGLDSVRSVRQVEKYIPFGIIQSNNGCNLAKISNLGISLPARNYSNGHNFNCNSFHILPNIKGCESLGPAAGAAHQSAFEQVINTENSERGTGKILGLITGLIDKVGLKTELPTDEEQIKQKNKEFMKNVIFSRHLIDQDIVSGGCFIPHSSSLKNPQISSDEGKYFDTRVHTLLLVWQKPNIWMPNLSSLTTCQLELLLSRDRKWDYLISRNIFNIERISFQTASAIIQNINSEKTEGLNSNNNTNRYGGILDIILPSHLRNPQNAQKLVDSSINKVQRDWSFASNKRLLNQDMGVKAQFTDELYEILFDMVVNNDLKPSVLIASSKFLCNYINCMDELLMKLYSS